jgi:adenylate kinase
VVISILGGPGSGKGVQSKLLAKKYSLYHISIGDALRKQSKLNPDSFKEYNKFMIKGKLVPDNLIVPFFEQIFVPLKKIDLIIDGFPRTECQTKYLFNEFKKYSVKIDAFIFLNFRKNILEKRNYGRVLCRKCGSAYNYYFMPPKIKGMCDKCGGLLVVRDDCGKETVSNRLNEYYIKTEPIKKILDEDLINVNGELSVIEVHGLIIEYLKQNGIV